MKHTIKVHRAQPIHDEDTFGVIYIDRDQKREGPRDYHASDATKIADVLLATLPGATVDLLFAELAKRKASKLIVSYDALEAPVEDRRKGRLPIENLERGGPIIVATIGYDVKVPVEKSDDDECARDCCGHTRAEHSGIDGVCEADVPSFGPMTCECNDFMSERPPVDRRPGKCGGRWCVAGTRIHCAVINGLARDGYDAKAIRLLYPHVELELLERVLLWLAEGGSDELRDEQNTAELDEALEKAKQINVDLADEARMLRARCNVMAGADSEGRWIWTTDDNHLETMSNDMPVQITAGTLRDLVRAGDPVAMLVADRSELRLRKYASSYAELDTGGLMALLCLLGEVSVRCNPEGEIVGGNIHRGKAALAALVQFGRDPLTLDQVGALMREAARK